MFDSVQNMLHRLAGLCSRSACLNTPSLPSGNNCESTTAVGVRAAFGAAVFQMASHDIGAISMNPVDLPGAFRGSNRLTERAPIHVSTSERIDASQLSAFTAFLRSHTGQPLCDFDALHDFSVREFRTFWRCFVQWSPGLEWSGAIEPVCDGDDCEHSSFFPQMQLNYADNLLRLSAANGDAPAVTACHADGRRIHLTRAQLRERVARVAQALSALGLGEGDRVVAVMRNDADAIVAALAVVITGWTTGCGPVIATALTLLGALTVWRHRENIRRLLSGTEHKFQRKRKS